MLHTLPRKKWVLAAEVVVALAILVFVVVYFRGLLRDMPERVPISPRAELLVLSGGLYLLAHLCWSAFWVRLLHFESVNVSWGIGLRTYYISQFGKYVPGKVAVLFMRVGMLRHRGDPIAVAVTATYETLTSMAAGALLAVLCLPAVGVISPQITGNITAVFAVVALPIGLGLLNKVAARLARKRRGPHARPLPAPSVFLLAQGMIHGACGYFLLALALGLTVRGLVPNAPDWTTKVFAAYLAAVGLAYVLGFVAFMLPGGLGAREAALATFLAPQLVPAVGTDAALAVAGVVALVLRLTWTISEVVVGLLLYAKKPALPPVHHSEMPHE